MAPRRVCAAIYLASADQLVATTPGGAGRPARGRTPPVPRACALSCGSARDGGGPYLRPKSRIGVLLPEYPGIMASVTGWANTVLISALTSSLVALGIEWFAKPRLEARKERLLRLHHARQTFEANVLTVLANSAKVSAAAGQRLPYDPKKEGTRRAFREEIARAVQQIDHATIEMSDNLAAYGLNYPTARIQNLIVRYVATARGTQLSSRTQVEKAEALTEITAPLHTWLFTRWWRFKSRYRAFMELPKTLAKYE